MCLMFRLYVAYLLYVFAMMTSNFSSSLAFIEATQVMSGMHHLPAGLYIGPTPLHFSPQLATKHLCMQLQSSNT